MTKGPFLIGIDLGTSNCSLSYIDKRSEDLSPQIFQIPQMSDDGVIKSNSLPSFLHYLGKGAVKSGKYRLAQHGEDDCIAYCLGHGAKQKSLQEPDRVVHSAKSWLSHGAIDRSEKILPWNSDQILGDKRMSPIQVSSLFLKHLKEAWDYEIAVGNKDLSFTNQDIVITVPASFDALSQELTLKAAHQAGFPDNCKLLEEPLSAFYHWSSLKNKEILENDKTILVCDIGGGTSDFSLLKTGANDSSVERVKVSPHILLGGDNIDLAIAHYLEQKLSPNSKLASYPWAQLLADSRRLKEDFLSLDGKDLYHISLDMGGSSLFGQTKSLKISATELQAIIEGFFPECPSNSKPQEDAAIQDWGLPYATDPAFSHHLSGFLAVSKIDYVLFAGGTMKPSILQDFILKRIESWQGHRPQKLEHENLDMAVALGASAYLQRKASKQGQVTSRFPKDLFIAVASNEGEKGLRILAKGSVPETTYTLDSKTLQATLNKKTMFKVYESSLDLEVDSDGLIHNLNSLHPIAAIVSKLESEDKKQKQMDVCLEVELTQTGLIAFRCIQKDGKQSWPLNFDLSGTKFQDISSHKTIKQIPEAKISPIVKSLYGKGKPAVQIKAKQLAKTLEEQLEASRKDWDLSQLRQLWLQLEPGLTRKGRSVDHESTWLNLSGYCLRPGFGHQGDDDFIQSIWKAYNLGPSHPKEASVMEQWWILWRRVAGGLNKQQQELIFDKISPALRKDKASSQQQYLLAGSLERVDMNRKIQLGNALAQSLADGSRNHLDVKIWCLARLASRVPLYSGPESVVRPSFVEAWAEKIAKLKQGPNYKNLNLFYLWAGRCVDDREFDISQESRSQFIEKLKTLKVNDESIKSVAEKTSITMVDKAVLFGEEMPLGLHIQL